LDTGDALVTGTPVVEGQTYVPGQALPVYHPLGDLTKGEVIVAGMNLMGYDAMALGPKDLTLGPDVLQQRMAEAEFPFLSANAVLADGGELLAPAYTIVETGPYRLGILGLTRQPKESVAGIEVRDPQVALERWLPEVAVEADVVILLTNLDFRAAVDLVRAVPGVDLLVAALPGQLPANVMHVPDTGTLAVTAEQAMERHSGRRVGELLLAVQPDGTISARSWQSVDMAKEFADDFEMAALLESYR
jgi:2',3'-cyclic-nucleotide 2'-phosphodiesterase (5'-nucleotidase family)